MRIAFDLDHVLAAGADPALCAATFGAVRAGRDRINALAPLYHGPGAAPCRLARTATCAVYDLPHVFGPGHSDAENARVLRALLDTLTAVNVIYLRAFPGTPRLRDTAVVYGRTTIWHPIPGLYKMRFGDCKSLASADAAEYALQGIVCRPVFRWNPREAWRANSVRDFHILNDVPALPQRFEDPSKRHGMNTPRALTHAAPDEVDAA